MIKLMFEKNKAFFIITIENRIVKYWDKLQGAVWGGPLQYLPPDYTNVMRKIDASRNKIPPHFKDLLLVTKDELMEYENAKTDEEIKEIIIADAKKNACVLVDVKYE